MAATWSLVITEQPEALKNWHKNIEIARSHRAIGKHVHLPHCMSEYKGEGRGSGKVRGGKEEGRGDRGTTDQYYGNKTNKT